MFQNVSTIPFCHEPNKITKKSLVQPFFTASFHFNDIERHYMPIQHICNRPKSAFNIGKRVHQSGPSRHNSPAGTWCKLSLSHWERKRRSSKHLSYTQCMSKCFLSHKNTSENETSKQSCIQLKTCFLWATAFFQLLLNHLEGGGVCQKSTNWCLRSYILQLTFAFSLHK